jgi:hypothetical protein
MRLVIIVASLAATRVAAAKSTSERHGVTFDAEVGVGEVVYTSVPPTTSLGLPDSTSSADGSAAALMMGAGVGVFINPWIAIGVRGLAAFARTTHVAYDPGLGLGSMYNTDFPANLSQQIVVLNGQAWFEDHLWGALGIGYGRSNFGGISNPGHAFQGVALDLRLGIATPYGFEVSVEATLMPTTEPAPTTAADHFDTARFGTAFLLGWQY